MARLTVYGARGSFPVFGDAYRRYGGQTSCFAVENDQGILVIDAGTGIRDLGQQLNELKVLPPITILFTHLHLDHLLGLAAFKPLLRRDAKITFMGDAKVHGDWPRVLQGLISAPYWPVDLIHMGAELSFTPLPAKGPLALYGHEIRSCPISHPQGCLGYRIESGKRSLVIATDYEIGEEMFDRGFAAFAKGADILVHDAQYTPDDYGAHKGWGHCTWQHAVETAERVGSKELILTSHDPVRTDEAVDRLLAAARARFPKSAAATPGMTLDLSQ